MNQMQAVANRQTQKKAVIVVAGLALVAVIVSAEFRFVSRLNDWLSGEPPYMRAIATALAQALELKLAGHSTILLARDEERKCQSVQRAQVGDRNQLYYFITYSEISYAYCLTVYAWATAGSEPEKVVTLNPDTGHNYGLRLTAPAKVVPIGYSSTAFSSVYLFPLLHWRAEPARHLKSALQNDAASQTAALHLPSGEQVSINLLDVRPEVHRRHDVINLILLNVIWILSFVLLVLVSRLWLIYKEIGRQCAVYHHQLGWLLFVFRDLNAIISEAQQEYDRGQKTAREQSRTQGILRHSQEEIRSKLESLLELIPQAHYRARIQNCLRNGDLQEMKQLLEDLQQRLGQRTPEERLLLLLEGLKPYCTPQEFEDQQRMTLELMAKLGYREARDFVTNAHGAFRARAKEREKRQEPSTDS